MKTFAVGAVTMPAVVAYAAKEFSILLILRVIVLRLLRMQPKGDTFICIEAHEGSSTAD